MWKGVSGSGDHRPNITKLLLDRLDSIILVVDDFAHVSGKSTPTQYRYFTDPVFLPSSITSPMSPLAATHTWRGSHHFRFSCRPPTAARFRYCLVTGLLAGTALPTSARPEDGGVNAWAINRCSSAGSRRACCERGCSS